MDSQVLTCFHNNELEIDMLIHRLFPICRSITGNGVRRTLEIISEHIPIDIKEIPTGTHVFDWTVPKEWNIKGAYIKDQKGNIIVDFENSNLHVLNYSIPVNMKVTLDELKKHIYTLPEHPDWVPYRTSYYNENWGFCMSHRQFEQLDEGEYEVLIDSTLETGHLSYGELYIKGECEEEFLLTCYVCHPSLFNDNLSGQVLLTFLTKYLLEKGKMRYSYRILFIPETIGAIAWLSLNEDKIGKIICGLVATCVGDSGKLTYKKSEIGNTEIDRVVEKVLEDSKCPYRIINFFPSGSDERQFCSPGINLSVGVLMRTPYGEFEEYHTSADNLDNLDISYLKNTMDTYIKVINVIESNKTYINLYPKGEPQLGRRGVYRTIGGENSVDLDCESIQWVLNQSNGKNSLLDISIRSCIEFSRIYNAAEALKKVGLIEES